MVVCPNCGQENKDDFRFCQACGTPLAAAPAPAPAPATDASPCPKCTAPNPQGMKFCKDCGSPLEAVAPPTPAPGPAPAPTPTPQAAAPGGVTCAGCGGETPSGFKFCQHCGAPLKEASAAPAPAPAAPTPASVPPATVLSPPKDPAPPIAAADSGPEARTILDMSDKGADDAQAQRPAAHTPPAGMPPGQAPAAAQTLDDSGTPAESAPGAADKTVGPSAGLSSTAAGIPKGVLARLVAVQRDGSDGDVHEVTDSSFDIGRVEGHLCFEDDGYLSDRHCRVHVADGEWRVQDLDSCNGVFVRITEPRELQSHEQVLLGKQVLRFERIERDEMDPASEHGVLLFGSPLTDVWGRLKQLTVAGVARDVYHLGRPQVTVGREEGNITFPDDEFMSRKHMAISFIEGKVIVQDLGSSNGTFVRLGDGCVLKPGTMLRVGDQLLRFELP